MWVVRFHASVRALSVDIPVPTHAAATDGEAIAYAQGYVRTERLER